MRMVVVALLTAAAAGAGSRSPTLAITRVTVDRAAQTVDLRLRVCFSSGPRAGIFVAERQTVRGVVTVRHRWSPRGVEPDRVEPYACKRGWRVNWLLEPGLGGPGTYAATVRVRDAYGRWTLPVGFTVSG